jgi:hypothetical protein
MSNERDLKETVSSCFEIISWFYTLCRSRQCVHRRVIRIGAAQESWFSPPHCPDWLWNLPPLLSKRYRSSFLVVKIPKLSDLVDLYLPPHAFKVMDKFTFTFTTTLKIVFLLFSRVRLGPLGTTVTSGPVVPAPGAQT